MIDRTGPARPALKNNDNNDMNNDMDDLSSRRDDLYMQIEALKMVSLKEFVEAQGPRDPRYGQMALKAIETQMRALAERQRSVSLRSLVPVRLLNAMMRVPELEAALKDRRVRGSLAKEIAKEIEDW